MNELPGLGVRVGRVAGRMAPFLCLPPHPQTCTNASPPSFPSSSTFHSLFKYFAFLFGMAMAFSLKIKLG